MERLNVRKRAGAILMALGLGMLAALVATPLLAFERLEKPVEVMEQPAAELGSDVEFIYHRVERGDEVGRYCAATFPAAAGRCREQTIWINDSSLAALGRIQPGDEILLPARPTLTPASVSTQGELVSDDLHPQVGANQESIEALGNELDELTAELRQLRGATNGDAASVAALAALEVRLATLEGSIRTARNADPAQAQQLNALRQALAEVRGEQAAQGAAVRRAAAAQAAQETGVTNLRSDVQTLQQPLFYAAVEQRVGAEWAMWYASHRYYVYVGAALTVLMLLTQLSLRPIRRQQRTQMDALTKTKRTANRAQTLGLAARQDINAVKRTVAEQGEFIEGIASKVERHDREIGTLIDEHDRLRHQVETWEEAMNKVLEELSGQVYTHEQLLAAVQQRLGQTEARLEECLELISGVRVADPDQVAEWRLRLLAQSPVGTSIEVPLLVRRGELEEVTLIRLEATGDNLLELQGVVRRSGSRKPEWVKCKPTNFTAALANAKCAGRLVGVERKLLPAPESPSEAAPAPAALAAE